MQTLHQRWVWFISKLLAQPQPRLILRLTAVIAVVHGIDYLHWSRLPEKILAAALLFYPNLITCRIVWVLLSTLVAWNTVGSWPFLVNHEYLITYWILVCTLALYAPVPGSVMAWNAKLLVGLCFFFATLWKLLSGEYFDGSFLHLTSLLDPRLSFIATLVGGIPDDILQTNRELLMTLRPGELTGPVALLTRPLMSPISQILSYWTILIEGLVALSFLLPQPRWLHQRRDWSLLVFIFTTYTLIPVFSFAAILLVLGLAQCKLEQRQRLYLAAWLLIPLWMLLPQALFYVLKAV